MTYLAEIPPFVFTLTSLLLLAGAVGGITYFVYRQQKKHIEKWASRFSMRYERARATVLPGSGTVHAIEGKWRGIDVRAEWETQSGKREAIHTIGVSAVVPAALPQGFYLIGGQVEQPACPEGLQPVGSGDPKFDEGFGCGALDVAKASKLLRDPELKRALAVAEAHLDSLCVANDMVRLLQRRATSDGLPPVSSVEALFVSAARIANALAGRPSGVPNSGQAPQKRKRAV